MLIRPIPLLLTLLFFLCFSSRFVSDADAQPTPDHQQSPGQSTQVIVDGSDRTKIVLDVALIFPANEVVTLEAGLLKAEEGIEGVECFGGVAEGH